MTTEKKPTRGLFLILLAGPGTRESRSRTLEALRLAQTIASVGGRRIRFLLAGEGVQWLRSKMRADELEAVVIEGSNGPISHELLEELQEVHEEVLESIHVMQGLGLRIMACTVSVSERGLEARSMELGIPLVAYPRQVDKALEEGWQLLSF